MPRFRVDDDQETIALDGTVTRIGHAFVLDTAVGTVLLDDDSTSGTFVNGCRVTRRVLEPGDEIAVGGLRMTYLDA
ncbi:MAG: Inner rane component of cytoplasmic domain [Solirubrobacteraceae bacterium]|nr:Inner rane component of cytoplasmic domain [Solirubrobacteraceae bacterium]